MPMVEEREPTTIITAGSREGAGWFIAGGLAVLIGVALWVFGGALVAGTQAFDVNIDVQVGNAEPTPASTEPAPEQAPAPSE